jgi:hypothetical protein
MQIAHINMNVEIGTVVAQRIFVSNFRYCVFAVYSNIQPHREENLKRGKGDITNSAVLADQVVNGIWHYQKQQKVTFISCCSTEQIDF